MTLEKMMDRIEEIASLLEKGEITLEESLKLYEEAVGLIAKASEKLDEAEQKVMLLTRGEHGPAVEEFAPDDRG